MAEKLLLKRLINPSLNVVNSSFRITGSCFQNSGSHSITNCVDIAKGSDTSGYSFYAPVDMTCVAVPGDASNMAYFESVNDVEFANGQIGKVSMTFGHANNMYVTAGTTYSQGTKIYEEGTANTKARHCHIRVGKGAFKSSKLVNNGVGPGFSDPQYDINTENGPMTISDAFYKDNMTVIYGEDEMKKRFKWRLSSQTRTNNQVWLNAKYSPFRIRQAPSTSGAQLIMVPEGGRARIVTFLPGIKSDKYQWAFVDYNNGQQYGYAQLDFKNYQTLSRSVFSPDLYLQATIQQFRVRPDINTISGSVLVGVGGKALIVGFMGERHSDGYQWARTSYGSVSNGYSQMDTYNCYTVDYTDASDSAV